MVVTITPAVANTVVNFELANTLGLIVIFVLLVLLIQKEILAASTGVRAKAFSQGLTIALAPLLLGFAVAALARLAGILW